ncbi:MAG: hypothetical protein MRY75_07620 [Marivita sp.]|uniref:hypothetical protein n=1 Tax=Marivita sp. TaxID=2003365 RepID=UPI0025C2C35D|nr:hypothetical protein [Marivita sp.]MCI5110409.1 hypothetical protein [Marivita sp.]
MSKDRACANNPALSRRAFVAGLAPAVLAPMSAAAMTSTTPSVAEHVERLLSSVVPHHHQDYQIVSKADLQALCSAANVEWRGHWGE